MAILAMFQLGTGVASASTSAVVTEKTNPTLGTILANNSGLTLYTLTNNGAPVACTGTCAVYWPPLTVPAGTAVSGPTGLGGIGAANDANGDAVTYQGDPLYTFIQDHSASDATGQGLQSFGGTWKVVQVTASAPTTTAPAPTTT
ncbi:MAG: COG4315 family predicted lipoprotein, partial [Acidimicrobiales bacterium]